MTPDRMHLFDVVFDAGGVHLRGSSSAVGRVKAPPVSISPWRVEFVVTGRSGETLFVGSVDHPLHPRHEYPLDPATGQLRTVFGLETEGALLLRVPAELPATRLAFFERRPTQDPGDPPIPLGEVSVVP